MPTQKLTLAIPIRVHATYQEKDEAVVGPEVDFESLPYFDEKLGMDMNPDRPYLAESIIPRPFSDTNFLLKKGMHLHWELPKFLRKTKYKAADAAEFPAVPNRWMVCRMSVSALVDEAADEDSKLVLEQSWIIESDALMTDLEEAKVSGHAQTSLHVDLYSGKRPYTYMGRVWTLEDWKRKPTNTNYTTWKAEHQQQALTAMGWGSPSFDTFYPNCQGVFGFHDPEGKKEHTYKVIGWYEDVADDYWLYYLKNLEFTKNYSEEIDALAHLSEPEKEKLKLDHFAKLLKAHLGIQYGDLEKPLQKFIQLKPDLSGYEDDDRISLDEVANPAHWDRMICTGLHSEVNLNQNKIDAIAPNAKRTLYGLGNTPTEALSALIVQFSTEIKPILEREYPHKSKFQGLSASKKKEQIDAEIAPLLKDSQELSKKLGRAKMEDALSAMLLSDRLKSQKMDIGPKFREYRHAGEFVANEGGLQWVIEQVKDQTKDHLTGEAEDKKLPPPLPAAILPLLENLNLAQREYDKTFRLLQSARFELYTDWYRYMHAAYPPPGETEEYVEVSEMAAMIKSRAISKIAELEIALGIKENNGQGALKATISTAKKILEKAIATENARIEADEDTLAAFKWAIQSRPAPRFWEPSPPALVVAIPRSEDKNLDANITADEARSMPLPCAFLEEAWDFTPGEAFPEAAIMDNNGIPWKPSLFSAMDDFAIFKGEWETEVYPLATMNAVTKGSNTYDPDFIKENYFLGENEPDLDFTPSLKSAPALAKVGSLYAGSTFVDQHLDSRYLQLLKKYRALQEKRIAQLEKALKKLSDPNNREHKRLSTELTQQHLFSKLAQQAEVFLNGHDLLVIPFNGFNDALIQRHKSTQLKPADPLGFEDYRDFAQEVADALHPDYQGVSPDPHNPFMPIRSGALQVLKIRLVDLFGRYLELEPKEVATVLSMEVPQVMDWAELRPRIAQPARWNFRFLQARLASSDQRSGDSQSHPESTPIHGWIIPNLLNHSLDFFQESGQYLGKIHRVDNQSKWKPKAEVTATGYVKKVIDWIVDSKKDTGFLSFFLEDVAEAMDNIHPHDREGQTAFSVFMGRPMAIVHLGVDLELQGAPVFNSSWADLRKDLSRDFRSTDKFEEVQFPYRLGEYRQRNDGLIGYWTLQNGNLADTFSVNDAVSATINTDKIEEAKRDLDAYLQDRKLRRQINYWHRDDAEGRNLLDYLLAENQGDGSVKKQDLIQTYPREGGQIWEKLKDAGFLTEEQPSAFIRHYSEANQLSMSAADEQQELIALMDPHGLIHLSSGIQPVKSIQLPEQFIKEALQRIEVAFLTAPVLSPEGELQITLPELNDYDWTWKEQNQWPSKKTADDKAVSTDKTPPFRTTANFPKRVVLREGELILKHKKEE